MYKNSLAIHCIAALAQYASLTPKVHTSGCTALRAYGARAKAWCLRKSGASLCTRKRLSVSLSLGPGRKPGAPPYTRRHLPVSLTITHSRSLHVQAEAAATAGGCRKITCVSIPPLPQLVSVLVLDDAVEVQKAKQKKSRSARPDLHAAAASSIAQRRLQCTNVPARSRPVYDSYPPPL